MDPTLVLRVSACEVDGEDCRAGARSSFRISGAPTLNDRAMSLKPICARKGLHYLARN